MMLMYNFLEYDVVALQETCLIPELVSRTTYGVEIVDLQTDGVNARIAPVTRDKVLEQAEGAKYSSRVGGGRWASAN